VSASGNLIGELKKISSSPGSAFFPEIAWNGEKHLVVWTDLSHETWVYDVWGNIKQGVVPGIEEAENPKSERPASGCPDPKLVVSPNPFSKTTAIRVQGLEVSKKQKNSLGIYDLSGRLIRTLTTNPYSLITTVYWDGMDDNEKKVPSGIYFVKLGTGGSKETKKLILIR